MYPESYLDDYRPGGLHPIDFGDKLGDDDRYEVFALLGSGGSATVWLCKDQLEKKWKAVKVLAAEDSNIESAAELKVIDHLHDATAEELDYNHIMLPEHHFWITGPNGRHLCLVLPVCGPSLGKVWGTYGHRPDVLQDICLQMAESMEYLHSKGICHGDFRPKNILFKLKGIEDLSEEEILELLDGERDRRVSNYADTDERDPHLPKFSYEETPLIHARKHRTHEILLIDFGEAYLISTPPKRLGIPRDYAAPEIVLNSSPPDFGTHTDVWALAATFCEICVGAGPIVDCDTVSYTESLEELLGPLVDPYRAVWIEEGYKGRGTLPPAIEIPLNQPVSQSAQSLADLKSQRIKELGYEFLEGIIRAKTGFEIGMAEGEVLRPHEKDMGNGGKRVELQLPSDKADLLYDLLVKIFKYLPKERLTIQEILAHPWLSDDPEAEAEAEVKKDIQDNEHTKVDGTEIENNIQVEDNMVSKPVEDNVRINEDMSAENDAEIQTDVNVNKDIGVQEETKSVKDIEASKAVEPQNDMYGLPAGDTVIIIQPGSQEEVSLRPAATHGTFTPKPSVSVRLAWATVHFGQMVMRGVSKVREIVCGL